MVIVVKENDIVTVGISVNECYKDMTDKDLTLKENVPIWKVNGTSGCYVIAEDTGFSIDLLRYADYIFKDVTDGDSVVTSVVPKMKELFNALDLIDKEGAWASRLIIIKNNNVFRIGNYFTVDEVDSQCVIGLADYVNGGLEEFKDLPPTERILNSVRGLQQLRNRKIFPITIFDTKSKKRKVYYK